MANKLFNEKERLLQELELQGITNKKILNTMRWVPRELFIPESLKNYAYENIALPIFAGQTISQPFTVAFMLELLEPGEEERILEIGTGSGYNAALLKSLVGESGKVFSLEISKPLCAFAKKNLENANIIFVDVFYQNGSEGLKEEAPFDRIIITASVNQIPLGLIDQLSSDNGILVAPVEKFPGYQVMTKIIKHGETIKASQYGKFQFVPMTGKIRQKKPSINERGY